MDTGALVSFDGPTALTLQADLFLLGSDGTATSGGAAALRRTDIGALSLGKRADFAVLNAPSYIHLSYRPGVDLIDSTWIGGQNVYQR